MDKLKQKLDDLNSFIQELENQIQIAKNESENNITSLKEQLAQVKEDKIKFASKSDFDSVQNCRRKEENFKFKIDAQWNRYAMLKNDLIELKKEKINLENHIKLEEDKIKRNNQILAQMDKVLKNYKESQNLKRAAIDSKINPENVEQWFEWGRNDYNQSYSYFYKEITQIDDYFKDLETQKLIKLMDEVVEVYKMTNSLKEASKIANVSYDTVQYWYEWGSKGFGEENTYFFKKLNE